MVNILFSSKTSSNNTSVIHREIRKPKTAHSHVKKHWVLKQTAQELMKTIRHATILNKANGEVHAKTLSRTLGITSETAYR